MDDSQNLRLNLNVEFRPPKEIFLEVRLIGLVPKDPTKEQSDSNTKKTLMAVQTVNLTEAILQNNHKLYSEGNIEPQNLELTLSNQKKRQIVFLTLSVKFI